MNAHSMTRLDTGLGWREVAAIAAGNRLTLSEGALLRVERARTIVEAIIEKGIRGYGINTGVGALCDEVIERHDQQQLSRNILPFLRRWPWLSLMTKAQCVQSDALRSFC